MWHEHYIKVWRIIKQKIDHVKEVEYKHDVESYAHCEDTLVEDEIKNVFATVTIDKDNLIVKVGFDYQAKLAFLKERLQSLSMIKMSELDQSVTRRKER